MGQPRKDASERTTACTRSGAHPEGPPTDGISPSLGAGLYSMYSAVRRAGTVAVELIGHGEDFEGAREIKNLDVGEHEDGYRSSQEPCPSSSDIAFSADTTYSTPDARVRMLMM